MSRADYRLLVISILALPLLLLALGQFLYIFGFLPDAPSTWQFLLPVIPALSAVTLIRLFKPMKETDLAKPADAAQPETSSAQPPLAPKVNAIRFKNGNTSENEEAIVRLITHPDLKCLKLFAAKHPPSSGTSNCLATNLPSLAALAEMKIQGFPSVFWVFDGTFLTAVRRTRYLEVQQVLDAACKSNKAWYCADDIELTDPLTPEDAAVYLDGLPTHQLDDTTRPRFFSLLSSLSEEQMNRLQG